MPELIRKTDLVADLSARVRGALQDADADANGLVDRRERRDLPRDVRGLADNTADRYLGGGGLPIDPYVQAYRAYVEQAVDRADRGNGMVLDTDLPAGIYNSVAAMRVADGPARPSLDRMFRELGRGGFSDDDLTTLIREAQAQGRLRAFAGKLLDAIKRPEMPRSDYSGAKFYETLAWYTDMTTGGQRDGRLTMPELRRAIDQAAQKYAGQVLQGGDSVSRMQTWKNIQKLRMLEGEIRKRSRDGLGASYPYEPRAMMRIDPNSPWNRANTIDSRAEFNERVIRGSYDKPVLVKYGLPYCMHCLLLENLQSVPAVADKYGDEIDVVKLWWNPNDPEMADITGVAQEQGVTKSPYFMVYDQGRMVREGYAFPDENGDGLEAILEGIVRG